MIKGHGNSAAEVMLIADGGSKEDASCEYALSGYQEVLLSQVIGKSFHLQETYRTCLIKEHLSYSAAGKNGKVPYYELEENKLLQEQYKEILLEEINTIQPNLLIPMGELSMRFLTELEGIRKFRGSVVIATPLRNLTKSPTKVLPILGPHLYNSEFKLRWLAKVDFGKVPLYAHDNVLPSESRHNLWICRTSAALRAFLSRSFRHDGLLVFDIETFMGIPTCLSFCFDGKESTCIPFMDKSIDLDNRVLMLQQVAEVLASPIKKVNQNIKYDWKRLECFGFQVTNVTGDTMLAASCLYPELPKNLGFLTSIYTDLPYFKDEGRYFDPTVHKKEQYYLYNAKDSLSTWQIHSKQQDEIDETGSRFVYNNLLKCLPLYKQMEQNGIRVDDEQRQRLLGKYISLFEIHKMKLHRLVGKEVNPMSPLQMSNLIYDELGFKGVKGTGEEILEKLLAEGKAERSPVYGKEILRTIIACRKLHKVTEILKSVAYPDGRWRSEYNLAGTETGRSTAGVTTDQYIVFEDSKKGTKVEIESYGRSFQTIAKHGFYIDGEPYGKEIRSIFVPSRGYTFVEIDLSQAEARVDAVLAGNFDILAVFDGPIGIHRLTGSWIYGCPPESIKKNTLQYHISKQCRHAGERNVKAERLALLAESLITIKEAQEALNTFHKYQPEIRNVFHRDIMECINATRILVAPNGRRRQFLDRIDSHLYNEAISHLPQAIVSDQTKFSLIPTMDWCGYYARLINEAHDGTLAEVPIGMEGSYISEYKKNVEMGIDFRHCSLSRDFVLSIPSEASVSKDSWLDLEDWKG
jgi:DNA polymerase I-like protein with 3'-5' exonuclease and polymerase domains